MGEVCDSLVFALFSLPDFSWFEFEIWSFESFHMDLNTWVPLGFHPSASFPSLTIIPSLVHHKLIFRIFFFNEKYPFSLRNPSQICLLQSNPNFYGSEKSEIIHKYSVNPRAPPWAKIFHHFLEYFFYRKYFLFWTEMVVSTTTTILLAPLWLIFLVHHHLSRWLLTSKAQLPTPSRLTLVTSQSYWSETY